MTTTLALDATHLALRAIGPWLATLVGAAGQDQLGSIELAVHEMATNSVDHAHSADGQLTIAGTVDARGVSIELSDHGVGFVPDAVVVPDPDRPQVRGYGLMIVEQLASELSYERLDDRNVWSARFEFSS